MERIYYHKDGGVWLPPHQPTTMGVRSRFSEFTRCFRQLTFRAAKLANEAFPLRYVGRKRRVYEDACESLRVKPLTAGDAKIRSFIKVEKLPFGKKPVVPRVISPRSPRYNLSLGVYLSHLEHAVYDIVGVILGGRTITKGLDSFSVGKLISDKWSKFSSPVAYGLDASRFDQHVSRAVLEWEHSIYQMFYSGADKSALSSLLKMQLRNKCVCYTDDGKIEYTTDGTRCSGDMNTALGNCLIMCAAVYSYMRERLPGVRYELVNNGDDCVVILDSGTSLDGIDSYFRDLGFILKVEAPSYIIEGIEFCQSRPVFDGNSHRMVRDPRVTLSKDAITVKPIDNPKVYTRYLKALGDCGMALCYGLPILQEYYNSQLRVCGPYTIPLEDPSLETGFFMMARGLPVGRHTVVTNAARVSFGAAFGVSLRTQLDLEKYYSTLDLRYRVGAQGIPPIHW